MGELNDIAPSKVRDLIFAYERQSSYIELPELSENGRQRAKSIGNVLSYKQFRQPNLEIHNISDIEKELVKIEVHLNYYEVYEKDTHVAFQEQLFNILTSMSSIDPEGHESIIQKKKELISEISNLARILNSKLPVEGTHAHKRSRKTYSNLIRKEEAVVSNISRSKEIKSVNGGLKSEEFHSSTKDSVDFSVSSTQDDITSVDLNRPESTSPVPETKEITPVESGFLPSVSKLKKFFSFKRDEKPEIRVTKASYSGLGRSQSLNLKSSTYVVTKKERVEERNKNKEESIREDEGGEDVENVTLKEGNGEPELYKENAKEIEEYRDTESDKLNISVSKLKSLFEDKKKEGDEGLGLITKNQTQLTPAFNLPYTEANLAAFRLKRTISGNYLNSTGIGILRNVDIKTKTEISKSKSLSDLKSESFHYSYKDDDLKNEIDDDDVISFSNQQDYSKEPPENYQEEEDDSGRQPESLTFNKVEILKKSFESLNNSVGTTVHKHENRKPISHTLELSSGPQSGFLEPESVTVESSFETSQIYSTGSPSNSTIENTTEDSEFEVTKEDEKEEAKTVVASGTVETLKQTFEHLNSTSVEASESAVTEPENESLKAAVESGTEEIQLSESVKDLKQSFENLSRSNSREQNPDSVETLRTIVVPVPAQISGVAVLQSYNEQSAVISTTSDQPEKNSYTVQLEPPSKEVPSELKVESNTIVIDKNAVENGGPAVPISLYNEEQIADSSEASAQKSFARAEIEHKTASLMKILEAPVGYSTITTGQSYNSQSELQSHFSEKTSLNHNNEGAETTFSEETSQQKLVSLNSSETTSQTSSPKMVHSLKEKDHNDSGDVVSSPDTATEKVSHTQIESEHSLKHLETTLSKSQENIIDEILKEGETLKDIDAEFERMLQEPE